MCAAPRARLAAPLAVALAVAALLGGCAPKPVVPASRIHLDVAWPGLHRVTSTDVLRAGISLPAADPATLRLTHFDRAVPVSVTGTAQDWALEFFALDDLPPDAPFAPYVLHWGDGRGESMQSLAARGPGALMTSYTETVHAGAPTLYAPQVGSLGTRWFVGSLGAPGDFSHVLTLTAPLTAEADLTVDVWGTTSDPANPDHHVLVRLNGTGVADARWDGRGPKTIRATIPAGLLRDGPNELRLTAPGDTGAKAEIALVEAVSLTHTRALRAVDDRLVFSGPAGRYVLNGFTDGPVTVLDVTDPAAPARGSLQAVGGRVSVDAPCAAATCRYAAVGPGGTRMVAGLRPTAEPRLRSPATQADYVIVAPRAFVAALEPLVKWRERSGLKVELATTEEIFDTFGAGLASPTSIRAFLGYARDQWAKPAPRAVLLAGKASYDTRDYLRAPNRNLVPTFLIATPHLGEAASDHAFVAPVGAGPAPAIGRIPAETPDQLKSVVDKIIAYESMPATATWQDGAVFVSDEKDAAFDVSADDLAAQLPATMAAGHIRLSQLKDVNSARSQLIDAWNTGVGLIAYIGHGSIDTWAAGPLFAPPHLRQLKNAGRLPILLTPTCLDGYFYHPQVDSLAEQLLFKPDGGVIGGIVPTGLSLAPAQHALMRRFIAELAGGGAPTLGDALVRAQHSLRPEDAAEREVLDTFVWLGDPALRNPYAGRP